MTCIRPESEGLRLLYVCLLPRCYQPQLVQSAAFQAYANSCLIWPARCNVPFLVRCDLGIVLVHCLVEVHRSPIRLSTAIKSANFDRNLDCEKTYCNPDRMGIISSRHSTFNRRSAIEPQSSRPWTGKRRRIVMAPWRLCLNRCFSNIFNTRTDQKVLTSRSFFPFHPTFLLVKSISGQTLG